MNINITIPYDIGDSIIHDGKTHTIKGIHCYIGEYGITTIRYYLGNQIFITTYPNGDIKQ